MWSLYIMFIRHMGYIGYHFWANKTENFVNKQNFQFMQTAWKNKPLEKTNRLKKRTDWKKRTTWKNKLLEKTNHLKKRTAWKTNLLEKPTAWKKESVKKKNRLEKRNAWKKRAIWKNEPLEKKVWTGPVNIYLFAQYLLIIYFSFLNLIPGTWYLEPDTWNLIPGN